MSSQAAIRTDAISENDRTFALKTLRDADVPDTAAQEILRAVAQKGLATLIEEAVRLGARRDAVARAVAVSMDMPIFPSSLTPSQRAAGASNKKPTRPHTCTEQWLLGRNRVLYVANPLDESSYASAYKQFGQDILAVGIISYEELLRQCEESGTQVSVPNATGGTGKTGAQKKGPPPDPEAYRHDRLINQWLRHAATVNASDIHIKPQDNEVVVRMRLDGESRQVANIPFGPGPLSSEYHELSNRILSRSNGQLGYFRKAFDGVFVYDEMPGRTIKVRVAAIPATLTNNTEPFYKFTLRLLGNRIDALQLEDLGIPNTEENPQLTKLRLLGENRHGMVLVTGPTGSGKTTTLSAVLQSLRSAYPNKEIYTLEDPVEIFIPGVTHTQVTDQLGFHDGLKNLLRQDPDIILLGEIRDLPVAKKAVEASQTGHLVLASLHTNSAVATISRLRELGLEPYNIAEMLRGVTAQRLCKKICDKCGIPARWGDLIDGKVELYHKPEMRSLMLHYRNVKTHYTDLRWKPEADDMVLVPNPKGCANCKSMGYKGRIMISELFEMTPELETLIVEGASASRIHTVARNKYGFLEMWEHAMSLVLAHEIAFDHAIDALGPRPAVLDTE